MTESYLCKCLDSVTKQTYQNLEIILVDDGSPDGCGRICDKYAAMDKRIQVIHQANGGVSVARNAAMRIVSGDFVSFVDSDDWIERDMYERMTQELICNGVDIVVCGHWEEYQKSKIFCGWKQNQVLDTERALEYLLRDEQMKSYLCDKLYRRKLFDGICFPEGTNFEDVAVQHKLFARANKVVCLARVLYHYRQRAGSIVSNISLKNRIDYYVALKTRYEDLKDDFPKFEHRLASHCVTASVSTWSIYYANPRKERKKYRQKLYEMSEFAARHETEKPEYEKFGVTGRIIIRLIPYTTGWSFAVARLCGLLYQIKHGRTL